MHDYNGILNSIKAAGKLCSCAMGMTHPRTGIYISALRLRSAIQTLNILIPSSKSYLLSTCPATVALEPSPRPLGASCSIRSLHAVPPTLTMSSTALTSKLPSPTSWAPLFTVGARKPSVSPPASRHPMWSPDPARGLSTARGFQGPAAPASQRSQDPWDLVPGVSSLLVVATPPRALDPVVSSQWDVVPVLSHP